MMEEMINDDIIKEMIEHMTNEDMASQITDIGGLNMVGFTSSWVGWFMMLSIAVLFIVAMIALMRWTNNQNQPTQSGHSALNILKERYAKGEIDKSEFEEKKKDLS